MTRVIFTASSTRPRTQNFFIHAFRRRLRKTCRLRRHSCETTMRSEARSKTLSTCPNAPSTYCSASYSRTAKTSPAVQGRMNFELCPTMKRRGLNVSIEHQHIDTYKWRHLIENFIGKLKEYRRIAMRCCKTDESFNAFISRAARHHSPEVNVNRPWSSPVLTA